MGVFDDKKFEKLDWMTQITETIDSELNTLLAKLPDRVEFNAEAIVSHINSSYNSFSIGQLVGEMIRVMNNTSSYDDDGITWQEEQVIQECFQFETSSEEIEVNSKNNTMTGALALVKVRSALEDEQLQRILGCRGIRAVENIGYNGDKSTVDRMNEILDILGQSDQFKRTNSKVKKRAAIVARLKQIFSTNEWRVRDAHLANNIGFWIRDYIKAGNLAALTNLCKVKVMTHNNMPIYSIQEEQ